MAAGDRLVAEAVECSPAEGPYRSHENGENADLREGQTVVDVERVDPHGAGAIEGQECFPVAADLTTRLAEADQLDTLPLDLVDQLDHDVRVRLERAYREIIATVPAACAGADGG